MCLKIKADYFSENTFKVSNQDVECYKLYIRKQNMWVTPFMNVPAPKLGELRYSKEPFNILGIHVNDKMETKSGIHSYLDIVSILMIILSNGVALVHSNPVVRRDIRIVKCVIPKGTRYLEGTTELGDSYSSEYLVDKEIVFQIDATANEAVDNMKELLRFIKDSVQLNYFK